MPRDESSEPSPDGGKQDERVEDEYFWQRARPLLDHIGVVASVALFVIIVVRVLMVSGFNSTTAMAIVQEVGAGQVMLGSVLASGWILAAGGCLLLGLLVLRGMRWREWWDSGLLNIALPVLTFCLWLLPLVVIFGLVAFIALTGVVRRKRGRRPPSDALVGTAGLIFLVLVLFGSTTPWVPASRIDPRDEPAYVGYIFKETDGELLVLRKSTRRLERIQESDLASRDWCDGRRTWLRTGLELWASSGYDRCPS